MGEYLRKSKTKKNIPMRVAAVLLCLTLFSTYFVSGLFARYSTSVQSGGHARVAKFSIQGGGAFTQSIETVLSPGEEKGVSLIIENNSEVAVEYTITAANVTNNLPLRFFLQKDGASEVDINNGTVFTDQQIPGSHTDKYTLFIQWPAPADEAAMTRALEQMGMVDYITVTVTAAQMD